jgi:hypothetical protein
MLPLRVSSVTVYVECKAILLQIIKIPADKVQK